MPTVTLEWRGAAEQDARFAELIAASFPAMAESLFKTTDLAFQESQQLVPVRTGTLKLSGKHWPTEIEGTIVIDTMSYGNEKTRTRLSISQDVGYEIFVHEGTNDQPGRKFLEKPVMEHMSDFMYRLSTSFWTALEAV